MKKEYLMTAEEALEMIGGELTGYEIQRLINHYPSYKWAHRKCLIEDILENRSPVVMAQHKKQAKGISDVVKQSDGGHTKWVTAKLRRFVRRVIFLRLRIDDGLTKRQANQIILRDYDMPSTKGKVKPESLQRTVRKDTQCNLLK